MKFGVLSCFPPSLCALLLCASGCVNIMVSESSRTYADKAAASAATSASTPAAPTQETDSLAHWREVKADENRYVIAVALGDSNTEVNWTSRGHLNWVGLLDAGMFEGGFATRHRVVYAGKSADTATHALERLDRDVISLHPDLVIIGFGTNDANANTPEEAEASLRTLIRRIRESCGCSILLRTPQPNFAEHPPKEGEPDVWPPQPKMDVMAEVIRRVAREEKVELVDHYALWTAPNQPYSPSYYRYNNLHPNEFGHRRLYAEIAPVLGLPAVFRWEKETAPPPPSQPPQPKSQE